MPVNAVEYEKFYKSSLKRTFESKDTQDVK